MALGNEQITPTEDFASRLPAFMDELRLAGYQIGVEEYVTAQTLLLRLADAGQLPKDLRCLKSFLGPLLCTCEREQTDFAIRFENWISGFADPEKKPSDKPGKAPKIESELEDLRKRSRMWIPLSAMTVLLAAALGFHFFMSRHSERMLTLPGLLTTLGTLSAFLLLVWTIRWGWWGHLARTFLARRMTAETFDVWPFWVKGLEGKLFQSVTLLRTAQEFRRHVRSEDHGLDIDATVRKTAHMGGWFSPVSGVRQTVPEYLILVDRATFRDHQAQWMDTLVNRLVQNDVFLKRYYFDRDPRSCVPEKGDPKPLNLLDLARRHPDHRLMIFSNGAGLTDPLTGAPVRWIEQFYTWEYRSLLTPETAENFQEHPLADADFMVMPANEDGLTALIEEMNAEFQARHQFGNPGKTLPDMLQGLSIRLRERLEPDAASMNELMETLQGFLDEKAWFWMGACAVYPDLNWNLTLTLGCTLKAEDGQILFDQERLTHLARLPWFRYGRMPDWLRHHLIESMGEAQEAMVREVLLGLMQTATKDVEQGDFRLEYARLHGTAMSRLAKRVFRMLSRKSGKYSPFQDHIFVTFMENRLSVRIPRMVRRVFRERRKTEREEVIRETPVAKPRIPKRITNSLGMEFVYIPPGTFMMGSPEDEEGRYDDETLHQVTLTRGFYMQTTQVTQAQWEKVMGNNPSHFKEDGENRPVEQVSWEDAQEFISKLNQMEVRGDYRLPTEAEWEYACRAGSSTRFCFGDDEKQLSEYAWYGENFEEGQTHPVGQKRPNAWGLYDMHGNVWEWCQDWFGDYPSDEVTDPTGARAGSVRVLRGGSWYNAARRCRSAYRTGPSSDVRDYGLGFRLVRSAP